MFKYGGVYTEVFTHVFRVAHYILTPRHNIIMLPHHHDTVVQNCVSLMIPLIKNSFSLHIRINSSVLLDCLALCWQRMAVILCNMHSKMSHLVD